MDHNLRRALEDLSHGEAKPFDVSAPFTVEEPIMALGTNQPSTDAQGTSLDTPPSDAVDDTSTQHNQPSEEVLEVKENSRIKIGDLVFTKDDLERLQSIQAKAGELTAKESELLLREEAVKANTTFLEKASGSKYIAPALQAMKNGATDEEAFRISMAAMGYVPPVTAPQEEKPKEEDPRSVWPPVGVEAGTVEYEQAYANHLEYKMEQRSQAMREDIMRELAGKETAKQEQISAEQRALEAKNATLAANKELISKELGALLPFDIRTLSTEQVAEVLAHLSDVGAKGDVPLDQASLMERNLTVGEVRYLALAAYPPGTANPYAAKTEEVLKPEGPTDDKKPLQPGGAAGPGQPQGASFTPDTMGGNGWMSLMDLKPIDK